ncbi:tetratricopeptide repeat protein [Actinomadura chibensis]|uniref:Sel1 repeat family protein n=1 Tax=Actinomadura chibensis TaxID=392828 RepID=A0A5D0NT59_9ACTN|nr:sel1 repeat family protein [Actinomadura chibensis]TYB47823.1 sel1 repeat family protein [Actinomadura chibensis]
MGRDGRPPPGPQPVLPEPLLRDAAPGYLDNNERARIGGTAWFPDALDELTVPHRRLPGPLVRHRPPPGAHPLYRLADYLEQHARTERTLVCPPASFWDAAVRHAHTPDELTALGQQAEIRGRYRHAVHCYQRASAAGDAYALFLLAERRNGAGDHESAAQLYQQATDAGHADALLDLARLREEGSDHQSAQRLARQATPASANPLMYLAELRMQAGDHRRAEQLYLHAADAGDTRALEGLARLREQAGDRHGAERLRRFGLTAAGDVEEPWT